MFLFQKYMNYNPIGLVPFQTRREYIPVGSGAASLRHMVFKDTKPIVSMTP